MPCLFSSVFSALKSHQPLKSSIHHFPFTRAIKSRVLTMLMQKIDTIAREPNQQSMHKNWSTSNGSDIKFLMLNLSKRDIWSIQKPMLDICTRLHNFVEVLFLSAFCRKRETLPKNYICKQTLKSFQFSSFGSRFYLFPLSMKNWLKHLYFLVSFWRCFPGF